MLSLKYIHISGVKFKKFKNFFSINLSARTEFSWTLTVIDFIGYYGCGIIYATNSYQKDFHSVNYLHMMHKYLR